jgi:putative colanic acid biosynthesis UDP-glucose lipid carrier transferase
MSSYAGDLRPLSDEPPEIAIIRFLLAPGLAVATLAACALAYGEPLSARYVTLAIVAFLVSLHVIGELPLTQGRAGTSIGPGQALFMKWLSVAGILLFLGFVTKLSGTFSRKLVLTWLVLTPFVLHFAQQCMLWLLPRVLASGAAARSRVIVGANALGSELARRLDDFPLLGTVRGFFDDRRRPRPGAAPAAGALIGGLGEAPEYVKRHRVNVVYVTLPVTTDPRVVRLVEELRDTTASVYYVPNTLPFDPIQPRVESIGGIPVIAVRETPFYGVNAALKRGVDVALATLALALAWPLMLALAAGVKLGSPGPALFRQRRYGLDGEEFVVYKFRTMSVCDDGERIEQARRNDPRLTRFGAFLRRTSLDELPQLLNVLEGSMSLVGPRPHAVAHNEEYRRLIRGYMIRHKVKPGITGWAQVNGLRGETGTVEKMRRRIEFDLDYVRHWSLALDFWILARTPWAVLRGANAY